MFSQQFVMPRAWPVPSFTKGPTGHRAAGDLWPRQQVCCDGMEECGGKVVHSNWLFWETQFLSEHPGDKYFLVLQRVTVIVESVAKTFQKLFCHASLF